LAVLILVLLHTRDNVEVSCEKVTISSATFSVEYVFHNMLGIDRLRATLHRCIL